MACNERSTKFWSRYPKLGNLFLFVISVGTPALSLGESSSHFSNLLTTVHAQITPPTTINLEDESSVSVNFLPIDREFQKFLDQNDFFDGISYVLVDANGVIHQNYFGDHHKDTVVMLASTSKVPAVMTLLALGEDPSSNFSIDQQVGEIFSVKGVYGDRTPKELLSNTSGIPGLNSLFLYGDHLCQFSYSAIVDFEDCGQTILTKTLYGSRPTGTAFDYGGSQWQLAGVSASVAANASWNHLVNRYLGDPCDLEVFTFGNMWEDLTRWNGMPDSLLGIHNPHIGGGAISNLADYAKLLQVHLNGGFCGEQQVLSNDAIASMRENLGGTVMDNPTPYGMGWWISEKNPDIYYDPGAFGSISFIDVARGFGGYVAIDDYSRTNASAPITLVRGTIIPLLQEAIDTARKSVIQSTGALSSKQKVSIKTISQCMNRRC